MNTIATLIECDFARDCVNGTVANSPQFISVTISCYCIDPSSPQSLSVFRIASLYVYAVSASGGRCVICSLASYKLPQFHGQQMGGNSLLHMYAMTISKSFTPRDQ